jgi:hypothetical protein
MNCGEKVESLLENVSQLVVGSGFTASLFESLPPTVSKGGKILQL